MKPLAALPATRRPALAVLLCTVIAAGCASTAAPVVYPPKTADAGHSQRLAQDVQQCRERAERSVGLNGRSAQDVARSGARVGAVGFAATAVGAIVNTSRDVWQRARSAAAAGVTGAAVKTAIEWNDPDEVYEEFVERCLRERGHHVLGWR